MKRVIICLALMLSVTACGYRGPDSIRSTRPEYNMAVQQTNDQEMLLNLVRIRYRDTLYFTTVERIAATQELNQTYGASAGLTRTHQAASNPPAATSLVGEIATGTLTLGSNSIAINEKPTVFYAPLEGERFVRQMMTPLNPDMLLLLVRSGWSIDRVLAVGVQEMNGLKNAPTASGPAPSRAPVYADFKESVLLMRALQRDGRLDLVKGAKGEGVDMVFTGEARSSDEARRLKELLRLDPAAERIHIVSGAEYRDRQTLTISTRSMVAALHYLSTGVEVPERDITDGKVRQTVTADGTPFDWQSMLEGVFRVQVADERPASASVTVNYRGAWFYIADNDLDSKSTFVLLTQLIALHSVPPAAGPPVSFSFGK